MKGKKQRGSASENTEQVFLGGDPPTVELSAPWGFPGSAINISSPMSEDGAVLVAFSIRHWPLWWGLFLNAVGMGFMYLL